MNTFVIRRNHLNLYDIAVCGMVICNLALYNYTSLVIVVQFATLIITVLVNLNHSNHQKQPLTSYIGFWIAFIVWCVLSIVWGGVKDTFNQMMISIIQCAIIGTVVIFYAGCENRKQKLITAFLFAGLILTFRIIISAPYSTWGTERVGKYIGYGNDGAGIVLACCAFLGLVRYSNVRKKKYTAYIVLFVIMIVLTGSRKSLLAALIACSSYLVFQTPNQSKKIKAYIISFLVLLVLYFAIMNVPILYSAIGVRFEGLLITLQGGRDYQYSLSSSAERMLHIKYGWQFFLEKPITGLGLDGYRYVCPIRMTYSHNNYIELLADLGIVGALLYYAIPVSCLHINKKQIKNEDNNIKLAIIPSFIIFLAIMDVGLVSYMNEAMQLMIATVIAYTASTYSEQK